LVSDVVVQANPARLPRQAAGRRMVPNPGLSGLCGGNKGPGRAMRSAVVRQCAVLVGGLGTRLGALTATTPKPILPCGDRPFLAWLMREMLRFGVEEFLLLTGHLS